MSKNPKILLALQPEAQSQNVLDQAVAWATRLDGELSLVSVVDPILSVDPLYGPGAVGASVVAAAEAQRNLLDWLADLSEQIPEARRGRVELLSGRVIPSLIKASEQADILMMGTHHRRDAALLFLGSVAEGVVRNAHSPVMILDVDARPLGAGPAKIRVPFDPAHPNAHGLEWVATHLPLAELAAVYVVPWRRIFGPSPETGSEIYDAAKARLGEALEEAGFGKVPHYPLIRSEINVGDALAVEAAEASVDLIVMPTHGRRGLARAVLGSVAERTVRASSQAVLVVR